MSRRLGVLASHPIQYQAPLFRELSKYLDLHVHYAHRQSADGQARAGFGVAFDWDVDLLSGYSHEFLTNVAPRPDVDRFFGCDSPAVAERIGAGGFDAFLVTGWYLKAYWQAVLACRRHGVPVMVRGDSRLGTMRGAFKSMLKSAAYPRLLALFDACLYTGQDSRDYFARYGVPDRRLFHAPHCVDNERFRSVAAKVTQAQARQRLGLPSEGKIALFAGKLLPRKRPLDLIEAVARLGTRGLRVGVAVAGEGELRPVMQAAADRAGVGVTFLGFRNQGELPTVYRAADLLALPSDASETWGLVVNEALACGVPVVVSDAVGCARDLVAAGRTGLVHRVGDVGALADAIDRVLSDPPPLQSIHAFADSHSVQAAARGVVDACGFVCRGDGGDEA